jgi:hypothetical protein
MKLDPVFLLVVLAFFLIVFLSIFGKGKTISKRFRCGKRRKMLLGQLTVLVLLAVTLITLAWPVRGMHSLIQGLLLSAVVLVPAFVFNMLVSLHYRSTESGSEGWFAPGDDFFAEDGKKKPTNINKPKGIDAEEVADGLRDFRTDSMSVIYLSAEVQPSDEFEINEGPSPSDNYVAANKNKPLTNAEALRGITRPAGDPDKSSEPTVEEQVESVSRFVQSYDLVGQNTVPLRADNVPDLPEKKNSLPPPRFNGLASASDKTVDLKSMDRGEMSGLVTSLRKDNGRLQKLVMAQHAVIESQRVSQNQSRKVARDAIRIMRNAQGNQKMAEKVARREKTERQRIQNDYQKVTTVFENAMSIILLNRETTYSSDSV